MQHLLTRRLFRNWLSLAGAIVASGGLFSFLLLLAIDLLAEHGNPYMGILAYVVAPGVVVLGVVLAGMGYWIQRRQEQKTTPEAPSLALVIDLSRSRDRKILGVFAACATVFLFVSAVGSYKTYNYTESVHFCGEACHLPMGPELTTSRHSTHARVDCVACHVGGGAKAYFKTKISGMRQLYHVVRNDFERPIRMEHSKLRPARETCEQCHWPQKFTGGFERINRHFLADEKNTPFTLRLLLNVGGGDPSSGPPGGIHWHMNLANKIEYIATDEQRRNIPWVRHTDENGVVTEYRMPDFKGDPAQFTIHTMDCMDCHNRPAHKFRSPNDAVDAALASGRIDRKIPWVKAKAVAALSQPYASTQEAIDKINVMLRGDYQYQPGVSALIAEVQSIYRNNFFPEMKADWRAYPDHLSHKEWDGCFRCHDGNHKTFDNKTPIRADNCKFCHAIIAQGNDEQIKKLNADGFNFIHIDSEYSDFSCTTCHTGTTQ